MTAASKPTKKITRRATGGNLPQWDLGDFYPGPSSPRIKSDLGKAHRRARAFRKRHEGRLAELDGSAFGAAIAEFERIGEIVSRIMSYAQLLLAADVSNAEVAQFHQSMHESVTAISTETLFFTLEINRLDDDVMAEKFEHPDAARYAPWIRDLRVFRRHQLSDDLECLLHEKAVAGRAAWVRLFEESTAGLRFPLGQRKLTLSEILDLLSDTDGTTRRRAAKSLGGVLGDNARLFALITNTLAKDKAIEDGWRHYPRPVSERNLTNQVEDDVVDALVCSVKQSYGALAHRYYRLKARWFGVDQLDYWDRNAPLPEAADRRYEWSEARDLVLAAYGAFDPELADNASLFFDRPWIDAALRSGKDPGAFCHPTVPSIHPYILLNFHGRARDVATLAHELGHGIHQILAAPQGALMSDTPLTLAETASVFGEMLTFQALLDGETEPQRRRILIAGKVEDMLNTVVRQIAFHDFECRVHDERRNGELLAERLGEIWLDVQSASLGPAIRFDDDYRHYWAYIPHFVHTPFYVYAYAFGDCLVNSLYDVYRAGHTNFAAKYSDMLRAGGTLRHKELLAPFGLNAEDPAFWGRGLGVVSGFIDELEVM
jgi:oligoendopeptidase F